MTTEEKNVTMFKITLTLEELKKLDEARIVLDALFRESRARDTITRIANALSTIQQLIEEINENDGLIEILTREDM